MVLSHTLEPVGVGCPNPAPPGEDTSPLRWMPRPQIVPPFAPEERYVYSSATRLSAKYGTSLEPVGYPRSTRAQNKVQP